ncbi:hypothetical protein TMES_01570 [Thalassospira mesophila]|uniref:Polysaccharide biosynthesis protein C-terminal domain-containing protein n=2 Tax=Thalassospira mesophila TaxID=1293891 RepID=A0A1Y2L5T0_9PROT|nr:hypothetical protein TMES_01570 [Thalassospira mesophila]
MRELALTQICIRTFTIPLIFIFVTQPNHGPRVIAANAIPMLIGGIISIFWIKKNNLVIWRRPRIYEIKAEFKESGAIFLSRIFIILYTTLTPTIIGVMTNATAVGQYVLADKVRNAAQSLLASISQAIFPRLSYLFKHDRKSALHLIKYSGTVLLFISICISIFLFIFSDKIALIMGGNGFDTAASILRWLSPLPSVIMISNILGVQIMLPNAMDKTFNKILACAGMLSLISITPSIYYYGVQGAAFTTLTVEIFVSSSMAILLFQCRKEILCTQTG